MAKEYLREIIEAIVVILTAAYKLIKIKNTENK